MWVKILENLEICCFENENGKKYRYESKMTGDKDSEIIGHDNNSPTQTSIQSPLHRFLKSVLSSNVIPSELDARIIRIKNDLEKNIVKLAKVDEKTVNDKLLDEKYTNLYTHFQDYLMEYDMTPLELIVSVTHCLGVGKPREIVRAFFGYFQTYCGEKGTNVIAIGGPASGKSFILQTALSMIPDERIIHGAKTVSYFFNKYEGRDMTGYIFEIGDLGGSEDDQATIEFRDKLKQLSTDGHTERGVTNKETMEQEDQVVRGYPSLSDTTAREEMVNEQEKTRSVMLSPSPIDTGKLVVFNFLMQNHGVYHNQIVKILNIRDSIKGLVYKYNPDKYDFFNPYMFCIEEHLKGHDDFNRKILEFDAILKLVTLLNTPQKLEHDMYLNDDYEQINTKVYLASKRDNLNALNIFNSANLLPDESRFANGIIKEYDVLPIEDGETLVDELWEDLVREKSEVSYNINEDGLIEISKELRQYCFTLKSLKSQHRNKQWYRKSKNYVADRINRLVDEEVIVNIGKEQGTHHNVYCLNKGMESNVESALPNFSKYNINRATSVFKMVYPNQVDEYMEFLENDKSYDTTDLFESVEPLIKDLPFLEEVFCEL